jgi:SH3-like domain-containing protein
MGIKITPFAFILGLFLLIPGILYAQTDSKSPFKSTPFPLPRFLSLDSEEVFVRTGPGQRYMIKYIYKKKGLPVEVILEYEAWRKIRDSDGDEGWVHKGLLSGKRTGLIKGSGKVPVYKKSDAGSRLIAFMEPKVMGYVPECAGAWCKFESGGYSGWIERKFIWGVYENEDFD